MQKSKLRQFKVYNLQFAICIARRNEGIALLMVIWVITVMMVTVLSFSLMARTEARSTLSFKEGMERKFMAEAGVERAIAELFYMKQNVNATVTIEGTEPWKADGTLYKGELSDGSYEVAIRGESGKLDINTVPDIILKNLLMNAGVKDGDADIIVDSIMDWKDPDDLHRMHGAESDYYMSLPNPYKAKNAGFEALEELLLVRGVTPELLYGGEGAKGVMDSLTVYSRSTTVNVNYASRDVLMAIPGIGEDAADRSIEYRQDKSFSGVNELQEALGEEYSAAAPYLSVADTNTYSIEAAGYRSGGKAGYPARAVVALDNNTQYRYLYYRSPAIHKAKQ